MTRTAANFELPIPFEYVESTIPPGMTIDEYRRSRPRKRSWWRAGATALRARGRTA